jgi:D-apionate oxidoisomerase
MTTITLIGAGGNMGGRIRRSLVGDPDYQLRCVEADPERARLLRGEGFEVGNLEQSLSAAEIAVMAVPDRFAGVVAPAVVTAMDPGATLVCLDPAAPHAGVIPRREDISLVVVHPTHPPLYDLLAEESAIARRDYWGGGHAHQALVCALAWGEESSFVAAERLARAMFRPISRSHRLSVEQMALLEPAMAETVAITCVDLLRETMAEVISRGVEEQAARDFMLGHIQIGLALLFGELDWELSAGAKEAVREARPRLFREDWKRVLDADEVKRSVAQITGTS